MSRKTQRYSKEFKAEAVRTVLENQLSISEGASRLSLPEGTLGQWVTALTSGGRVSNVWETARWRGITTGNGS
nr:transposase [Escherichia coli]